MTNIPANQSAIPIDKVEYYLIAPFRIRDKKAFEKSITNALSSDLWTPIDRNKGSLAEHLLMFLGLRSSAEDPILTTGLAYQTNFQSSKDSFLSTWKSDIRFVKQNDKDYDIENPVVQPNQTMELYIAPNRSCGIAVLHLSGKQKTLSEVVEMNYILHKTDSKQAPKMKRKSGFDSTTRTPIWSDMEIPSSPGETQCGTLLDIFKHAMPTKEYIWENHNKLVMATYVAVNASKNDKELVQKDIVNIGQTKNNSYQFAWNSLGAVTELYSNILAYATPEGFACCVMNDQGAEAGDFIRNFGTDAFRKSYLPIFLSTVMADIIVTNAIRHIDTVARCEKEHNLVREAQLAVSLSPSHYDHLIRLMDICKKGRQFDDKAASIRDHIEARKMQLESNVNYILGFIGVGQVVFAILQLTGVNYILGEHFGNSPGAKWTVIVTGIIFIAAIVVYFARLFKGRVRK